MPPPLRNKGGFIISLNRFVKWLGEQAEARGIGLFPGFAGVDLLFERDRLIGIRTGDRGLDKQGQPKTSYEPGVDILAKAVVFGEGVRGSLTKQLVSRLQLDAGRDSPLYGLGIKEVWEVPEQPGMRGLVLHTLGFPLKSEDYGGGFLYHMGNLISVGLVVGLDYKAPYLDPYHEFQRFKLHPLVSSFLTNGSIVHTGAKALPEGGYYTIPKSFFPGGLLIGDAAELLDARRLKGIHLAMKSGMLAAETLYQALLKGDFGESTLRMYEQLLRDSWAGRELHDARNFRQGFEHGLWKGLFHEAFQMITGGRGPRRRLRNKPGYQQMLRVREYPRQRGVFPEIFQPDGKTSFDKATGLYYAGIHHEEDQPAHLLIADSGICHTRCVQEYGNPCQHFCPAQVYEMVEDTGDRSHRLHLNPSNCLHCKTCDIMDPYQIITWVPPEGGSGPNFVNL
jgi:electron-transferring-flavoprotein dehydrogenase